jgi:predicted amidohydrolase
MAPKFKVALIQLYAEPVQAEKNFGKAESFIRSAAAQGAAIAVLPEYHLSGWAPEDPEFLVIAEKWNEYLNRYCDLARELKICIVPGTIIQPEKNESSGETKLFNIAFFIDDTGKVVGEYRKKNLWYV